jgi:hypothetical protein
MPCAPSLTTNPFSQFCALTESVTSALEIPPQFVADLSKRFDNDANFLFLILERTNAQDLILRLDYNGFFTSKLLRQRGPESRGSLPEAT